MESLRFDVFSKNNGSIVSVEERRFLCSLLYRLTDGVQLLKASKDSD